jgi:CRP-like cAMP-binding protein
MIEDLERSLQTHPFATALEPDMVTFLVGCTKNARYRTGDYLLREGDREDTLFLIRQGTVAVEMPRAGGEPVCVETLGAGDVLGVSLMTPIRTPLDCRARETVLAFAIDNACLQRKMDADPRLGYAISKHLLERTYQRLSRARLQHLDVYR